MTKVYIGGMFGGMSRALRAHFETHPDFDLTEDYRVADAVVVTSGRMFVRPAEELGEGEVSELIELNYFRPRRLMESVIDQWRYRKRGGVIIVLGSNSAIEAKPNVEDYAALKSAMMVYCRHRATAVRADGIRITYLALGGIATESFWETAGQHADPALLATVKPDFAKAMQPSEVVWWIETVMRAPENTTLVNALLKPAQYV